MQTTLTPVSADRTQVRGEHLAPALAETERGILRVVTINTHRGRGPKIPYVVNGLSEADAERIHLLHDTRAYAFHIADWLRKHHDRYHVVGLQEVFHGVLGHHWFRGRQRDYYRRFSGYPTSLSHRVGFRGFRYENVLLSRLDVIPTRRLHTHLPCPMFYLASGGFTLAPFRFGKRTVWIGNTHLHSYNPRARAKQAIAISRAIRRLGDVPIVFMGDLNAVPPGCKNGDFQHGDRDTRSYRGDRTFDILGGAGLRLAPHADRPEYWTYPIGAVNRTLDYVLHSRHFEIESYRVVHEFTLSDHHPVEAALRLIDRD